MGTVPLLSRCGCHALRCERTRQFLLAVSKLSCFERSAALKATRFVARRDQSTKRAHSLRGEVAIVGFHLQELPQRSGEEGAQTCEGWRETNAGKTWLKSGVTTDETSMTLRRLDVLCKIALFLRKVADLSSSILASGTLKVSNSDQLFLAGKSHHEVETSTSSPSFRSSELSQPI